MVDNHSVKILVGCCTIDYNTRGFVPSLVKLVQDWTGSPLIFHEEWRKSLPFAQNGCVEAAYWKGCTHILFLEDDTTEIYSKLLIKEIFNKRHVITFLM